MKDAEDANFGLGNDDSAFIRNGEMIVQLVEKLHAYSILTGNPKFSPAIDKYECQGSCRMDIIESVIN